MGLDLRTLTQTLVSANGNSLAKECQYIIGGSTSFWSGKPHFALKHFLWKIFRKMKGYDKNGHGNMVWHPEFIIFNHNKRSVGHKMVMHEMPHCCQEYNGLHFLLTKLWYVRVLNLKRKWCQSRVKWVNTELCHAHSQAQLRTKMRNIRILPWNLCTNSTMVICVCCDVQCLFSLETGAKLRMWYTRAIVFFQH